MRPYESFQIDRSIETWFRSNSMLITYSFILPLVIFIAYIHLNALNPGTVKNYFYIFYFCAIAGNMIYIGLLASNNS